MGLGNKIEFIAKGGEKNSISLFNIFYIEIVNRDMRNIYISKPNEDDVICIESYGRLSNNKLITEILGEKDFIQIHQKYIVPKLRAIGRDGKWKFISIKTTAWKKKSKQNEQFRTKELPIGAAYLKRMQSFFFNDSRTEFRHKPDRDEEAEFVYVFIDTITHIVSDNRSYKRTLHLNSPIRFGANSYIIEEYSNKPLNTYLERLELYPVHFRVHQKYIVNFSCVVKRSRNWSYLVVKTFDKDEKKPVEVKIPIGRTYKDKMKELFEKVKIDN